MTTLAIGLILFSALLHAIWNLLAKRAQGGPAFIWLYDTFALLIFAPVIGLFVVLTHPQLTTWSWLAMLGSGLLELGYFLALLRAYRLGDLSIVYPVVRGTGPALATIAAILLFHEHPTLIALLGTCGIVGGVFLIAYSPSASDHTISPAALGYALLTGCCVAAYTLWDKAAVSVIGLAPVLLYYSTVCLRVIVLAPVAARRWSEVRYYYRHYRREALGIAVLSAVAYVLVLSALTFAPVSTIAPTREIGVLFGVLLGSRFLSEGDQPRRLFSAAIIVMGIVALAI